MTTAALLSALLALQAGAPPVTSRVEHYDVRGWTAAQVRADVNRKRPRTPEGERFDAYTHWFVRWNYRYAPGDRGCEVTSFTTRVEVVMHLPRLVGRSAPDVQRQWNRYVEALEKHEQNHADVGIRAAKVVQDTGRSLRPAPTCQALEQEIARRSEAVLDAHRSQDVAYDARTRHGEREGIVFP